MIQNNYRFACFQTLGFFNLIIPDLSIKSKILHMIITRYIVPLHVQMDRYKRQQPCLS